MRFDAIVLAGGRSERLGGADKSAFTVDGVTLLARACHAVSRARRVVVVGPTPDTLPGIEVVREDPPFGGPAAAIGAGLATLGAGAADLVAIMACDLPYADRAMGPLLTVAAAGFDADALIAADESGKRQTLLGIYRTTSLRAAIARHPTLDGMAVRALCDTFTFIEVPVPAGSTRDIDTWHDVEHLGIEHRGLSHTEVEP